jgi:hypothetical protein
MRVILQEGKGRGWNDKLEPLREDHEIPRPVFGAMVNGTLLLELSAAQGTVDFNDLTEREQARVTALTKSTRPYLSRATQVPVKFPARLNITDDVKLHEVSASRVLSQAREYFNDYSIDLGSFTLAPILRSVIPA